MSKAGTRNRLDLYLPERRPAPPVILWVHGGGWTRGTRPPPGFQLATRGYAVLR